MKVFVYSKRNSKKLEQIDDVVKVQVNERKKEIILRTSNGDTFKFDTQLVKTTAYQN